MKARCRRDFATMLPDLNFCDAILLKGPMIPLSNLAIFDIGGDDARAFLQNQLSADIDAIHIGGAGYACCCNPAGRVLALMLIIPLDDRVLAVLSADLAEEIRAWLNRFILRSDVRIKLRTDLFVATGGAAEVTRAAIGPVEPLDGLSYALLDEPFPDIDPETSGASRWKAEELRHGVCWLDSESSAQFLPQMLGFEAIGALNFRKGCFPGQEVIARTRYLGKLKRRPMLLEVETEKRWPVMSKLTLETADGAISGVLVDQGKSDRGHCMFVVARADADVEPSGLEIEGEHLALA